jgi:formylglycine-generating enzyme required for sulfatase activity
MSDIFISYASEDRARARTIAQALETEGWSVWWDRNIRTGGRFDQIIQEEIGKARCVVVLWSAISVTRDWVIEEASEGRKRQILMPVLAERVEPPWGFRLLQAADLSDWRGETGHATFRQLCQDISGLLGPASRPTVEKAPLEKPKPDSPVAPVRAPKRVRHNWDWEGAVLRRRWALGGGLLALLACAGLLAYRLAYVTKPPPARGNKLVITAPQSDPKGQPQDAGNQTATTVVRGEKKTLQSKLEDLPDRKSPGYKQRDDATVKPGTESKREVRVNPADGLTYVYISAGTFTMGCSPGDNDCDSDEKPPHAVQIANGFWLGQTEVTQAAWKKVMNTDPSHFKGDQLPVESVDWTQAGNYCKAIGGRLPTEQEWEYAARAGTTGSRYGTLDAVAWYYGNSGRTTHPVGLKQPSAFGLYDMLGNVWEWTVSDYDTTGKYKTVRGGSWLYGTRSVRASLRNGSEPSLRFNNLGFRCVGELR